VKASQVQYSLSLSLPPNWGVTTPALLNELDGEAGDSLKAMLSSLNGFDFLEEASTLDPQPLISWLSVPIPSPDNGGQAIGSISAWILVAILMSPGDAFVPDEILDIDGKLIKKKSVTQNYNYAGKVDFEYFQVQYQMTLAPNVEIYVNAQSPDILLKDFFEVIFDEIVSTLNVES